MPSSVLSPINRHELNVVRYVERMTNFDINQEEIKFRLPFEFQEDVEYKINVYSLIPHNVMILSLI